MNGIEDLVRETLAQRAHDVDRVQLNAPVTRPARSRHWIAVGTVVAVAAAILVAVVLVAPWHSTGRRAGPARPQTPPAGMQWVSVHGITLTVPDTWAVGTFPCSTPTTSAVVVPGPVIYCPMLPNQPDPPADSDIVTVKLLNGPTQGETITVAGRAAYRDVQVDGPPADSYVHIQLPSVGLVLGLRLGGATTEQDVLDTVEYTPVDHYGCPAQQPAPATVPGGPLDAPTDITSGVVCEYGAGTVDSRGLIGSRELDQHEITGILELARHAAPAALPQPLILGDGYGVHEYLLGLPGGATWILTADPRTGQIVLSDDAHNAVSRAAVSALPGAYTG